jgi:hypothetical protein
MQVVHDPSTRYFWAASSKGCFLCAPHSLPEETLHDRAKHTTRRLALSSCLTSQFTQARWQIEAVPSSTCLLTGCLT